MVGMKLDEAYELARMWQEDLRPYCERIEIAGSVRRGKAEVKDIELVAAPIVNYNPDLFGNPTAAYNLLDGVIQARARIGNFVLQKNGERYKQLALPEGINIDLFIVMPPAQWGVIYTIRTGPADFSHWVVTPRKHNGALPSDCKVQDGAVWRAGEMVAMAEEGDFLDFLDLGWIKPEERVARWGWGRG